LEYKPPEKNVVTLQGSLAKTANPKTLILAESSAQDVFMDSPEGLQSVVTEHRNGLRRAEPETPVQKMMCEQREREKGVWIEDKGGQREDSAHASCQIQAHPV
jgi:hypothetical protein